jgi:hypothetical protein
MVYRGHVENGVVCLEDSPMLPEGAEVEVRLIAEAASRPWLPFVRKQLRAIEGLPDGWDSHGAPRPDARLVRAGQALIERLAALADVPQPYVNPTRSGGVQFEWEAGDRYFELEVVAQRAAEYLYCDGTARVQDTGKVLEGESLEPIVAYIRKVGVLP